MSETQEIASGISSERVSAEAFFNGFLEVAAQGETEEIVFAVERLLTVVGGLSPEIAREVTAIMVDRRLPGVSPPPESGQRIIKRVPVGPNTRLEIIISAAAYVVTAETTKLSPVQQLDCSVLAVKYAAGQIWLEDPTLSVEAAQNEALEAYLNELDHYINYIVEKMANSKEAEQLAAGLTSAKVIGDLETDLVDHFDPQGEDEEVLAKV